MNKIIEAQKLLGDVWMQRDLGWIAFNQRVLHEAQDERNPWMERLKFLAIFSSNLDEFFMKRMELIQSLLKDGAYAEWEADLPMQIQRNLSPLLETQHRIFSQIRQGLADEGVELLDFSQLSESQKQETCLAFRKNILPILTPLAVDPSHPFPFLSNLSSSYGVLLNAPGFQDGRFARLKIPNSVPGWLRLQSNAGNKMQLVCTNSVIQANLGDVFPGYEIISTTLFRVTRDAEVEFNDEILDIKQHVNDQLKQRRFEPVVRLEVDANNDSRVVELLQREFSLSDCQVYRVPGLMDYQKLWELCVLGPDHLRSPRWEPRFPAEFCEPDADLWELIKKQDLLVHHPYESFDLSVVRFIMEAAMDPKVRAIKMTVYRVGDQTPFVQSLIQAAEAGKQVACLIEVRARFDEQRNLQWAAKLERAGAHVVYGVVGLKTHSKIALVVRDEPDGLRCYAHIGTGNYHVNTSKLYTDLGLFTSDGQITQDIVDLFNFLTGCSAKKEYHRLLVSPTNMRSTLDALIDREIAHAQAGCQARIILKMNQLEDVGMISKLVEASAAGVRIELIVRGFCCLKPGIPGRTENISVRSIIGRFLEHSRVFWFSNGKQDPVQGDFFIGSADWMNRNLSGRVEAVTPVSRKEHRQRIWDILEISLKDQRNAWIMQPDGSYLQAKPSPNSDPDARLGTQATLMQKSGNNNFLDSKVPKICGES
jgi:polyphosphate kinase